MTKRRRRTFDPEFKKDAVKLILEGGRSCNSVAKDLGIRQGTLNEWKLKYLEDPNRSFSEKEVYSSEKRRIKKLEKELRDAKEDNAILKKALAIFSSKPE